MVSGTEMNFAGYKNTRSCATGGINGNETNPVFKFYIFSGHLHSDFHFSNTKK
jgi:hypothetical protein